MHGLKAGSNDFDLDLAGQLSQGGRPRSIPLHVTPFASAGGPIFHLLVASGGFELAC